MRATGDRRAMERRESQTEDRAGSVPRQTGVGRGTSDAWEPDGQAELPLMEQATVDGAGCLPADLIAAKHGLNAGPASAAAATSAPSAARRPAEPIRTQRRSAVYTGR